MLCMSVMGAKLTPEKQAEIAAEEEFHDTTTCISFEPSDGPANLKDVMANFQKVSNAVHECDGRQTYPEKQAEIAAEEEFHDTTTRISFEPSDGPANLKDVMANFQKVSNAVHECDGRQTYPEKQAEIAAEEEFHDTTTRISFEPSDGPANLKDVMANFQKVSNAVHECDGRQTYPEKQAEIAAEEEFHDTTTRISFEPSDGPADLKDVMATIFEREEEDSHSSSYASIIVDDGHSAGDSEWENISAYSSKGVPVPKEEMREIFAGLNLDDIFGKNYPEDGADFRYQGKTLRRVRHLNSRSLPSS